MEKYSTLVLRIGLGIVFIWFGYQQLTAPDFWTRLLPSWTTIFSLEKTILIYINGYFEVIFGSVLILGLYTRMVAVILAVHLVNIICAVGYNATGIRDFGLLMAMISLALNKKDSWSILQFIKNKNTNNTEI